jgi:hypothetical protein
MAARTSTTSLASLALGKGPSLQGKATQGMAGRGASVDRHVIAWPHAKELGRPLTAPQPAGLAPPPAPATQPPQRARPLLAKCALMASATT